MATRVDGTVYIVEGDTTYGFRYQPYFYYTENNSSPTSYSLTLYGGIRCYNPSNYQMGPEYEKLTMTGTGKTTKSTETDQVYAPAKSWKDTQVISSFTWSWNKTKSSQTVTITAYEYMGGAGYKASKTFTIQPIAHHTVSYNANGGTGAPGNQTKWHGENLTLQTGIPTRADANNCHYTFKGWATTQARANAGTVDYKPGQTYTANGTTAVTLYAVWVVEYTSPVIGKITSLRAKSNGSADDEGTYLNISFPWSVDRTGYLDNTGQSVKLEYKLTTASSWTTIGTYTISGASGTFSKTKLTSGSFSVDNAYDLRITLTDAHGSSVAQDTLSGSFYIMDVSPDGYGIGFGVAAPEPASKDDAKMKINMDLEIGLKYSGTPGSATGEDADLVNALAALGWTDCIE